LLNISSCLKNIKPEDLKKCEEVLEQIESALTIDGFNSSDFEKWKNSQLKMIEKATLGEFKGSAAE
jgi:ribosome-binding protein aMBF1 (putative translation factor)